MRCRSPYSPQVYSMIMDFGEAMVKSFDRELSGAVLITAIEEAAQLPLSTIMKYGSQALVDNLTNFLAEILELLRRGKAWKVGGLVPQVFSLAKGYRFKSRAAR